jgi:hypothetical protein
VLDEGAEVRLAIRRPVVLDHPVVRVSEMSMGEPRVGIELHGTTEQRDSLLAVGAGGPPEVP